MPKILVIADDFTGAAEIGGLAHLFGLSVKIQTGIKEAVLPEDDVLVLDTNTRSLDPTEAYKTITNLIDQLDVSAFDFVYKKVDSVLRGPIVPEIRAILTRLDLNHAVLVSANPSKGRIVKDGMYYINGVPIDKTEFQFDPEYPRKSPLVRDLVRNTIDKSGSDPPLNDEKYDHIEIPDAFSQANLKEIVTSGLKESSLAAGGSDFFTAILRYKLNLEQSIKTAYNPGKGKRHFVIGTRSENGIGTIKELQKQGYPCFYLPGKSLENKVLYEEFIHGIIVTIEKGHPLIIARPETELRGQVALRKITELLSGSANTLIKKCNTGDEIFIEGGETASNIIRNQNTNLRITEVLGAGVVKLELNHSGISLIVKPGSYPWPKNFFNFTRRKKVINNEDRNK
jgi:uncharacterized protein YgbK (DUF1537 family)